MRTGYHLLKVTVFLTGVLTLAYVAPGLVTAQTNGLTNKSVTSFDLSRINEEVIREFEKAWLRSGSGTRDIEGAVLIMLNSDDTYKCVEVGKTNEYNKVTYQWHPGAIAMGHTHPSRRDPKPSQTDRQIADKVGVPIFTLTRYGMYIYDPTTKKTSKVMDGLDWLDLSKWNQRRLPC